MCLDCENSSGALVFFEDLSVIVVVNITKILLLNSTFKSRIPLLIRKRPGLLNTAIARKVTL